ncbi:MAG: 50S ribosomal protein L3 N(5)-glutamine methyltransferase [Gammaproteobacteria bacterium]
MNTKFSDISNNLTTIRDYIRWGSSRFAEAGLFFGHGTVTPLDEAAAIVLHTLHQPYDLSPVYFDSVLLPSERRAVVELFQRRIQERKPAAYLTHEAIFAGLPFYVDERVLVPRSPIAELIDARFTPWQEPEEVKSVLDLCTGSACIAIACAYAFPRATVDAVELSDDALAVAEINLQKHADAIAVNVYQSDLFDELPAKRYDIIVGNPPYVAMEEWRKLPPEYHCEPAIGLKGGENGLDLVLRILADAGAYLEQKGILVIEVGSSAETLQNLFPAVPFYWLEFERGGDGVFLLTAEQVEEFTPLFKQALK